MRPTIAAKTASTALPERRRRVEFLSRHPVQVHRQVQMLKHSPRYQSGIEVVVCLLLDRLPLTKSTWTEQTSNEMRLLPDIGDASACCTACLMTQSFNNGTGNRSDLAELIDLCQSLPFGGCFSGLNAIENGRLIQLEAWISACIVVPDTRMVNNAIPR